MDIQKEREAFDQYFKEKYQEFHNEVFDENGDDRAIIGYSFAWSAWQAAKAQAVPEGFVLVSKDNLSVFWQDSDEPENFCSSESDFDDLGDCIELGDIMEINKHTQAHIQTEKLSGTWFAEAIDPSEKANFFVGTHEECIAIVEKNKAMIEAQEPAK